MRNRTEQSTAVETLRRMGYEWKGGALWKPPLGETPGYVQATDFGAISDEVVWDGDGLPPVGVECEVMFTLDTHPAWSKCKIIFTSGSVGVIDIHGASYAFTAVGSNGHSAKFRPIETPEQKQEKLILERYPQARPASDGVKLGDVLINHIDVQPIIATKDIIKRFDSHQFYWVIANVGDGYHFISDIKQP